MSQPPRVCIIGAGPSGLTTGKNLLQAGIDQFVIYEKGTEVGGNWVYSPRSGHSSIYRSAHTISSKTLSQFEDYPFPPEYPAYPSHSQIVAYFRNYAQHFDVLKHVSFNSEVQRVSRREPKGWRVDLSAGKTESFDALLICNGHHSHPYMPSWPGTFQGSMLHSHDYKTPEPFKDQRVLVVGAGNSGCDIAVELSGVARDVAISLRRGYHFVPKVILGVPSDVVLSWCWRIPRPLLQRLAAFIVARFNPPPEGLPRPDHKIFETHPIVNTRFSAAVREKRIRVLRDIEAFDGHAVRFADQSSQPFDAVVFCTGYEARFPFFGPELEHLAAPDAPLYLRMQTPVYDDLFFIGLFQPSGCIWPLADLQARLAANHLTGRCRLPDHPEQAAMAERAENARCFVNSPRHRVEVDYHRFRRELLRRLSRCAS
jgi:Flavin-binding monooxygenase-like